MSAPTLALLYAIENRQPAKGMYALDEGADPNVEVGSSFQESGLVRCILWANHNLAKAMLKAGADPNRRPRGATGMYTTPLHAACTIGWVDGIPELLSHGADINAIDENGCRPIDLATISMDATRLMVSAGADINQLNADGQSPFHLALHRAAGLGGLLAELASANIRELVELGADLLKPEGLMSPEFSPPVDLHVRAAGRTPLQIIEKPGFMARKELDWFVSLAQAAQAREIIRHTRLNVVAQGAHGAHP